MQEEESLEMFTLKQMENQDYKQKGNGSGFIHHFMDIGYIKPIKV